MDADANGCLDKMLNRPWKFPRKTLQLIPTCCWKKLELMERKGNKKVSQGPCEITSKVHQQLHL